MPYRISDYARGFIPRPITELLLLHAGRPAVVIGGGPSVPWYFVRGLSPALPPDDAVIITANGHGSRLALAGVCRTPDYCVCVDDDQEPVLRPYGVPLVTQRPFADIQLFTKPVFSSGMLGCWVAWLLGCAPIIPLGMDMYSGGTKQVYFDNPDAVSAGSWVPPAQHLEHWQKLLEVVPDDVFRAPAGSALAALFEAYSPAERFDPAADLEVRRNASKGERVRFLRLHPRERGGGHHRPGDVLELPVAQARRLRREGAVDLLDVALADT